MRNDDPEKRARLQVRIVQLHPITTRGDLKGDTVTADVTSRASGRLSEPDAPNDAGILPQHLPWAEAALPWGGKTPQTGGDANGFFFLPEVGSTVWVGFEQGFTGRPIWFGSWLGESDTPPEYITPDTRFLRTPSGHLLMFDDRDGQELIRIATLDGNGDRVRFLTLDEANQEVTLQSGEDDVGGRVFMDGSQVLITQGSKTSDNRVTMTDTDLTVEVGASGTTITVDSSGNVSITNSGNTDVNTTGNVTVTAVGDVIANCTNANINAAANILLGGAGAIQGVCLDSLITVIAAMVVVFNAHTHQYAPGPGVPIPTAGPNTPQVSPILGVNSSSTVFAKL